MLGLVVSSPLTIYLCFLASTGFGPLLYVHTLNDRLLLSFQCVLMQIFQKMDFRSCHSPQHRLVCKLWNYNIIINNYLLL